MKLSKRLQAISDMVTDGFTLADIGTDHGYIPVYRTAMGLAPKALAMDVAEGPLSRAAESIAKYQVEDRVITRLSDGLAGLKPYETDSIVIAGMGGPLMIRILEDGLETAKAAKELILSPHSEIGDVRYFLYEKGFKIIDERILIDEGKYYFILKATVGNMEEPVGATKLFGNILAKRQDPVMGEYLENERKLCEKILENLRVNSKDKEERMAEMSERLSYIEEALKNYENC